MPTKGGQEQFLGKKLSHTLAFVRYFVAAAATVYQEPHFWRTEGQELFVFLFDQKDFWV